MENYCLLEILKRYFFTYLSFETKKMMSLIAKIQQNYAFIFNKYVKTLTFIVIIICPSTQCFCPFIKPLRHSFSIGKFHIFDNLYLY